MLDSEIYTAAEDSLLLSDVLKKIIPEMLNKSKNLKFLEIGCGSGIQLQTAFDAEIKKENIFSCDINKGAVECCKKLGFNCVYSDLFDAFKGKYDIIVFNPPYLPENKLEPKSSRISTTGGKRGGEIINKFLKQAEEHLTPNGKIILLVS